MVGVAVVGECGGSLLPLLLLGFFPSTHAGNYDHVLCTAVVEMVVALVDGRHILGGVGSAVGPPRKCHIALCTVAILPALWAEWF